MTTSMETTSPTPGWVDEYQFEDGAVGEPPRHRRSRWWLLLPVLLLAIVGAGVWIVNPFGTAAAALVTGQATSGTIVASVSISGSVASSSINELNFGTSGTVTSVPVAPGDKVTAGQVLASIDDSALKVQLQTAQANLTAAEARLALDQAGPTAATIASAQDSVSQAQLQLTTATQSLADTNAQNAQNIAQGTAALSAANATLAADTLALAPGDPQLAKDAAAVTAAETNLSATNLEVTLAVHQAQAQVSSARLGVTTAKHNYTLKIVPATAAQIASDQASVAQAQSALATLQQTGATISSPIDGTVTVVNIKVGQTVTGSTGTGSSSSTTAQIEVMDLAHLQIAGQASETDIPKLKVGQPATITAAALGTDAVTGKVCALSIVGQQISGVTSFGMTVCIDGADPALLVGMSATAAVVTSRADNAILVPSLAVKTVGGQKVVAVLGKDGKTQTNVPVTVGISNGSQTQILTGLSGTETVVESIQTTTQTRGGGGRNFPGGGFGG